MKVQLQKKCLRRKLSIYSQKSQVSIILPEWLVSFRKFLIHLPRWCLEKNIISFFPNSLFIKLDIYLNWKNFIAIVKKKSHSSEKWILTCNIVSLFFCMLCDLTAFKKHTFSSCFHIHCSFFSFLMAAIRIFLLVQLSRMLDINVKFHFNPNF